MKLADLSDAMLRTIGHGVEKESLRTLTDGSLALTPHPKALGSALTHPRITTDFSESQLELVTGVHHDIEDCYQELWQIHRAVFATIRHELLWSCSMPCTLPTDETIPLGRYGTSNIGRAKSIYRLGLANRYGRRMQTISGIHYNWSMQGLGNEDYFALIRNFRRQAFLLLYLFGASPVVCKSFLQGREHELQGFDGGFYLPYATSLRMGNLGYQSQAQENIYASFNSLDGYLKSLYSALVEPYPAYEKIGICNLGQEYNQLNTSLLQIENEFYSTIRPKRTIYKGERPLHALCQRGVEYIEVRCIDLNPFIATGIDGPTMRFLDIFLLHCLLQKSPPDNTKELAALARNQQKTASQGRAPGLELERYGKNYALEKWAMEIADQCYPIAKRLDKIYSQESYQQALNNVIHILENPHLLPSAQQIQILKNKPRQRFQSWGVQQSQNAKGKILTTPWGRDDQAYFDKLAKESRLQQKHIEAEDNIPFETFRLNYTSPQSLVCS
jgi:glutamate--cysteine ligase